MPYPWIKSLSLGFKFPRVSWLKYFSLAVLPLSSFFLLLIIDGLIFFHFTSLILCTALLPQPLVLFLNICLMSASFVLIHSNIPNQQQLKHLFLQLVQSCSCMKIFSPSCCQLWEVHLEENWLSAGFRVAGSDVTSRSKYWCKNIM